MKKIPIEVSARHIHLTREDVDKLFGKDYQLTNIKDLSQPNMFASKEKVDIVNPDDEKKRINGIRIVGPTRNYTQIELSFSDARKIDINPPIRTSGNLEGTPKVKIVGPKGEIEKDKGIIVARRHIHMTPEDAKNIQVEDGQIVQIKAGQKGERGLIFDDVKIRVSKSYKLACHIDTDEGNAGAIKNNQTCIIVG